jgi:hypothetical protein
VEGLKSYGRQDGVRLGSVPMACILRKCSVFPEQVKDCSALQFEAGTGPSG